MDDVSVIGVLGKNSLMKKYVIKNIQIQIAKRQLECKKRRACLTRRCLCRLVVIDISKKKYESNKEYEADLKACDCFAVIYKAEPKKYIDKLFADIVQYSKNDTIPVFAVHKKNKDIKHNLLMTSEKLLTYDSLERVVSGYSRRVNSLISELYNQTFTILMEDLFDALCET